MDKLLFPLHISLFYLLSFSWVNKASADETTFSFGVGWPYLAVPTVIIQHDNFEYYVNYKLGLDDGFSLGIQSQDGHHVYGAFIGAIGARKVSAKCQNDFTCEHFVINLFDKKTTQGLGLSYEYRFSRENNNTWGLRAEVGYGQESMNSSNRADWNLQLLYHF